MQKLRLPYNEILSGDYVRDILNNIVSLWFTTDGLMDMFVLLCFVFVSFFVFWHPKHKKHQSLVLMFNFLF